LGKLRTEEKSKEILEQILKKNRLKVYISCCIKEIPDKREQKRIINDLHDSPTGGHMGTHKMYYRLKSRYYWPEMRKEVEAKVKHCQTNKHSLIGHVPMTITNTALTTLDRVFVDLCDPLQRSEE
jgi:hypothetical protein